MSPVPIRAHTSLPSVAGEGEAMLPSSFLWALLPDATIVRRQRSLPAVPTHNSSSWPLASAEVRKIESPQMQGVAPAEPGKGNRQAM